MAEARGFSRAGVREALEIRCGRLLCPRAHERPARLYFAAMRPNVVALLLALTLVGDAASPALSPGRSTNWAAQAGPLTDAQIEQFLATARVVQTRGIGKGVTDSIRATLSDGTLTHDAQIQTIDETKREFRTKQGLELNFRDSWHFNVAAYRIDRLLRLELVPVSVARSWRNTPGAFTWWIDDVLMDEGERLKRKLPPPDSRCWLDQRGLVRMFDQLIDNTDRNLGNMLIAKNWRIWAIDHTRAFRSSNSPKNLTELTGIDRAVFARLEALDFAAVKQAVDGHIRDSDIRRLLSRRDAIVAHLKTLGEAALYDRRDPASGCVR